VQGLTKSILVNSPTLSGKLPLPAAIFSMIFLKIRVFSQIKEISLFLMSELSSLFIANSKISLFLRKNLPLDHRKKVHMYENLKSEYLQNTLLTHTVMLVG
jgi:hypothetical protein